MPSIRIEMFEGRTPEQKRVLARELTDATVRALGVPADSVDIMMFDIPRHDWATAGVLWSERKPSAPKAP
jgi:4-oxalocrotonate tautomerase